MSDLRDRIAATIYRSASQWDDYPWDSLAGHVKEAFLGQADAVILELGLSLERGQRSNSTGVAWAADNRHNVRRWVTGWERADG